MRWPWVLRATMDAAILQAQADGCEEGYSRRHDALEAQRDRLVKENETLTAQQSSIRADLRQVTDAFTNEMERSSKEGSRAHAEEQKRLRAEVRAQEWEAIANELIAKGMGRPTIDTPAKEESALARKIRDEAAGDSMLATHFWKNVVAPARAAGKKDEEIVGMIGWTTADPPEVTE